MTTITLPRQVVQQALDAIASIPEDVEGSMPEALTDAVIALRAALEQPQADHFADAGKMMQAERALSESAPAAPTQEPVGEIGDFMSGRRVVWHNTVMPPSGTKLYTHPAPDHAALLPRTVMDDAMRYRWLRTAINEAGDVQMAAQACLLQPDADRMDDAIDAALKGTP